MSDQQQPYSGWNASGQGAPDQPYQATGQQPYQQAPQQAPQHVPTAPFVPAPVAPAAPKTDANGVPYGIGPFTLREVIFLGLSFVLFLVSFLPAVAAEGIDYNNLWSGFWGAVPLVLLVVVAAVLVALRRFVPTTSWRVGSLSVDQFASVVVIITSISYLVAMILIAQVSSAFDDAFGGFIRLGIAPGTAFIIGFFISLGLLAVTTFAPFIPAFRTDFTTRPETAAHVTARTVIAVPRRPVAPAAQAAYPVAPQPGGFAQTGVQQPYQPQGYAQTGAPLAQSGYAAQAQTPLQDPAATPASAPGYGQPQAAQTGYSETPSYQAQAAPAPAQEAPPAQDAVTAQDVLPTEDASPVQAPESEVAPAYQAPFVASAIDEDTVVRVDRTQFAEQYQAEQNLVEPLETEAQAADLSGTAAHDAAVQDAAVQDAAVAEAAVAEAEVAQTPAEPAAEHPVAAAPAAEESLPAPAAQSTQPFWVLAPEARDVIDADSGESVFQIGPTAWALAVEDRGAELVIRHDDGRLGVLSNIDNLLRG